MLQGELKVWIPAGGWLRSSLVPQSGKLSEAAPVFPRVAGTKIYNVDNVGSARTPGDPAALPVGNRKEPTFAAAESFYVEAPMNCVWSRAFALFDGDSPLCHGGFGILEPTAESADQPRRYLVARGRSIRQVRVSMAT